MLVCERSNRWAAALRRSATRQDWLESGDRRVVETRSLVACGQQLAAEPESLVAVEWTWANADRVVPWVLECRERFPSCVMVGLCGPPWSRQLEASTTWLLRSGAQLICRSPQDLVLVWQLAVRQRRRHPPRPLPWRQAAWEALPWAAWGSGEGHQSTGATSR